METVLVFAVNYRQCSLQLKEKWIHNHPKAHFKWLSSEKLK